MSLKDNKAVELALKQGELEPLLVEGLAAVDRLFEIAHSSHKQAKRADLLLRQLALLAELDASELAAIGDNQAVTRYARILLALHNAKKFEIVVDDVELVLRILNANQNRFAQTAHEILTQITDQVVQTKLCRIALENDDEPLKTLVRQAGYLPHEPYTRALYLFLTDQWVAYQELDFDYTLLKTAYKLENNAIQRRIAAKIRELGHIELIEVLTAEVDLELSLEILVKHQAWSKLWEFAQSVPAIWSVKALSQLPASEWQADTFGLLELASTCNQTELSLGRLLRPSRLKISRASPAHNSGVIQIAFSPDGSLLASLDNLGALCMWQLPTGGLAYKVEDKYRIHSFEFSPDGQLLAAVGTNMDTIEGETWLLEAPSGKLAKTIGSQSYPIHTQLTFVAGGTILTISNYYEVRLYSLVQNDFLTTVDIPSSKYPHCPIINVQGGNLADVTPDNQLRFWQMPSYTLIKTVIIQDPLRGIWLQFSPDGRFLIVNVYDGFLVYSSAGELVYRLDHLYHSPRVYFSFDSTFFVFSALADRTTHLEIRNISDGGLFRKITLDTVKNSSFSETSDASSPYDFVGIERILWKYRFTFSPDDRMIICADEKALRIWRIEDGQLVAKFGLSTAPICDPLISPNGQMLVTTNHSKVHLWKSRLVSLASKPLTELSLGDFRWIQRTVVSKLPNQNERLWLKFMEALLKRKWQHELELATFVVGDADIELED